jgi:hypothetical protein
MRGEYERGVCGGECREVGMRGGHGRSVFEECMRGVYEGSVERSE